MTESTFRSTLEDILDVASGTSAIPTRANEFGPEPNSDLPEAGTFGDLIRVLAEQSAFTA